MAGCRHRYEDGSHCRSPESFVDLQTGFCRSHNPDNREELSEQGRRGAQATTKKLRGSGLGTDDLPPLDNHAAARTWLEVIGRAVATGKIKDRDATAAIRAVEAWLKVRGEEITLSVVEELRAEVDRLKSEMAGKPKLGMSN